MCAEKKNGRRAHSAQILQAYAHCGPILEDPRIVPSILENEDTAHTHYTNQSVRTPSNLRRRLPFLKSKLISARSSWSVVSRAARTASMSRSVARSTACRPSSPQKSMIPPRYSSREHTEKMERKRWGALAELRQHRRMAFPTHIIPDACGAEKKVSHFTSLSVATFPDSR